MDGDWLGGVGYTLRYADGREPLRCTTNWCPPTRYARVASTDRSRIVRCDRVPDRAPLELAV